MRPQASKPATSDEIEKYYITPDTTRTVRTRINQKGVMNYTRIDVYVYMDKIIRENFTSKTSTVSFKCCKNTRVLHPLHIATAINRRPNNNLHNNQPLLFSSQTLATHTPLSTAACPTDECDLSARDITQMRSKT